MRNTVSYEWDVETLDGEDIIDHNCSDTLTELPKEPNERLCLVRDLGNESKGLVERAWAYVEDGKLPETFKDSRDEDTGIKVPLRFHKELAKLSNL